MSRLFLLILIGISSLLSSCTGYPRIINFRFDPGGRGLNSRALELTPQTQGNVIVFVSDRNGSQDVYLFDAQRQQLVNLPGLNSLDEVASHPSISQDGRYIVFEGSRLGKSAIYLYDRQTQQKRNLTPSLSAAVRNPVISADGNRIAFEAATDGQWDILVYDINGQAIE